jgi:hypothetical protein
MDFRSNGPEHLYGAIGVKAIRYGPSPCSAGLRHLLVPTCFRPGCCAQRRSRVGRRPIAERLALLTAASTAADLRGRGGLRLGQLGRYRVELAHRARRSRATNLYSADPRIATTMQSCASAAKLREGRAHSKPRYKDHSPTSGCRQPRFISCSSASIRRWAAATQSSLCGRAQKQTGRRLAGCHQPPQRNKELARERHDHRLARAAAGIGSSLPIPRGQSLAF